MDPEKATPQPQLKRNGPVPATPKPTAPDPIVARTPRASRSTSTQQPVADQSSSEGAVEPRVLSEGWARWGNRLGLVTLVLALGIALFGGPGPDSEELHVNYAKHVQPLEESNAATGEQMIRKVARSGYWTHQRELEVGQPLVEDTRLIRDQLALNDRAQAQAEFARLQTIPELDPDTPVPPGWIPQKPTLTSGMQMNLAAGDADLYQLYLYDNLAEDGDIVDVYIDGERFCTVPITHQGATLTVPAVKGKTHSVALLGIHDGGGGITVGFRSSEGDYFTERMAVGQTRIVAMVTK